MLFHIFLIKAAFLHRRGEVERTRHDLDRELIFVDYLAVERIGKALGRLNLNLLSLTVDYDVLKVLAVEVLAVGVGRKYLQEAQAGNGFCKADLYQSVVELGAGRAFEGAADILPVCDGAQQEVPSGFITSPSALTVQRFFMLFTSAFTMPLV